MPEKKGEELMRQIATRVPESTYQIIEKDHKEKGFRSKSDYVANVVEDYIKGDSSPTSDTTYIPKSSVTAQYQNLLTRIEELENKLSEQNEQLQMIMTLTFFIIFRFTRPSKYRLSKDEFDNVLQKIAQLADSDDGVTGSDIQSLAREIISNDPVLHFKPEGVR